MPNIVLNNNWIENISRSKAMKEDITINIMYGTSFEDIELLREEMEKFVRHPDNSRDFQPDIAMGVSSLGDLDKMALDIVIKHKSNWHNEIVRATRRSKFMCALALAMQKVPIFGPPGGLEALGAASNPSYAVAVSDEFAATARDKFAKDADAARLVPAATKSEQANPGDSDSTKERKAMQDFNTRDPSNEEEWGYRMGDNDNETLRGSRSGRVSEDRRRSHEVGGDHSVYGGSDLVKRSSTRGGRRKAGECITQMSLGGEQRDPESHQVQPSPSRLETFDEEAQTETSPYGGTLGGYYNDQTGVDRSYSQSQGQAGSYAAYRVQSNTLSPTQSRPTQQYPRPSGQGQGQGAPPGPPPQR